MWRGLAEARRGAAAREHSSKTRLQGARAQRSRGPNRPNIEETARLQRAPVASARLCARTRPDTLCTPPYPLARSAAGSPHTRRHVASCRLGACSASRVLVRRLSCGCSASRQASRGTRGSRSRRWQPRRPHGDQPASTNPALRVARGGAAARRSGGRPLAGSRDGAALQPLATNATRSDARGAHRNDGAGGQASPQASARSEATLWGVALGPCPSPRVSFGRMRRRSAIRKTRLVRGSAATGRP